METIFKVERVTLADRVMGFIRMAMWRMKRERNRHEQWYIKRVL